MKPELQVKFLQHLNRKKQDEGFTLIELLVVIIIIGILAAIALPSFLNQANKARESEAKQYTGSMNRAQQAYYLEKTDFSSDISVLGLGIKTQTDNYSYIIQTQAASGNTAAINQARPAKAASAPVRAYMGLVALGVQTGTSEATTLTTLCQGIKPAVANGGVPLGTETPTFNSAAAPTCPSGTYEPIK